MRYPSFDDWFYEIEVFSMRCERAYAIFWQPEIREWLEAAWAAAREPACSSEHEAAPSPDKNTAESMVGATGIEPVTPPV